MKDIYILCLLNFRTIDEKIMNFEQQVLQRLDQMAEDLSELKEFKGEALKKFDQLSIDFSEIREEV